MPHPEPPQERRKEKNALTESVGRSLPRSPRIDVKRKNYIDDYIFGKMEEDKIPHAGLSSDSEFMRRAYLDLTGRIPEGAEVRKFIDDKSPDKRDKLIDFLVNPDRYAFQKRDPFIDRWTYWFAERFESNSGEIGEQGLHVFYDYIQACLRMNIPYNEWVEEMLTATAVTNWYSGPSNFLVRFHVDGGVNQINHEDSADEMAIGTARIFLGLNLECISCHAGEGHLEKINVWLTERKREEVWQLAAFFANLQIYRPPPRRQEFTMQEFTTRGYDDEAYPITVPLGYNTEAPSEIRIKRYKADIVPTFILTGESPKPGEKPRQALARMLTQHPQFARATVNFFWAELMGVGIVDPPDNFDLARMDPKNPPPAPWTVQPTHPELLEAMAEDFRTHHYDLRYLIKLITKSSAYQLSARFDGPWKEEYSRYYARRFVRRLSAEELFDAISQGTGVFPEIGPEKVKYVMQVRAPEEIKGDLIDVNRFLQFFGQHNRSRGVKSLKGNPVQASLLLNSKVVKERTKYRPDGRLHKLLNQDPPLSNEQLVEELFLSVLSRFPTPEEKKVAVEQIREYRTQGAEDVLWALINKLDFIFNY